MLSAAVRALRIAKNAIVRVADALIAADEAIVTAANVAFQHNIKPSFAAVTDALTQSVSGCYTVPILFAAAVASSDESFVIVNRLIIRWAATVSVACVLKETCRMLRPPGATLYSTEYGMPSTHAAVSLGVLHDVPGIEWVAPVWGTATGITRVLQSEHYVRDIVGGWFLGMIVSQAETAAWSAVVSSRITSAELRMYIFMALALGAVLAVTAPYDEKPNGAPDAVDATTPERPCSNRRATADLRSMLSGFLSYVMCNCALALAREWMCIAWVLFPIIVAIVCAEMAARGAGCRWYACGPYTSGGAVAVIAHIVF